MVTSFVLINCDLGTEERVLKEIVNLSEEIVEAHAFYGLYDIIVKIKADNQDSRDVLLQLIRKLRHIRATVTLNAIPRLGGRGD